MKNIILFTLALLMGFLGITQDIKGQTKVFDQTITWEHPPYEYGGYGFYWWHRTDGYSNINYGNMPSDSWAAYYGGNFTLSVEVVSQPTDEDFYIQFGIWGDNYKGSLHTETVASRKSISGGAGSSGTFSLGSPSGWWNKQPSDPLDFSRADDFYRIGVVLWDGASTCIPMGHDWSTNGCPENADKYFPMTVKISVYATTGGYVPPVGNPDYSIDYGSERTSEDISTDDQYSYDDFGGGTVYDGAGTKLNLTPGTNVYFRKEADWSKKQTLTVPYRPGAPSFEIDYANERTSSSVSSEYQYSSNSDMSSATTGTGSYVSLTPGSSTYFRKFSTGSAFASVIQDLFMSSEGNPNYSIDYGSERTSEDISTDDQYSYDDFGGGTVYDGAGTKLNLTPGTNVYFRKEADWSKKQTLTVAYRPGAPSFGIDYGNERTSSSVSSEYEYSSNSDMSSATTGSGSYVSLTLGSSTYFRKLATGSAFASAIQELFMSAVGNPNYSIDYWGEQTTEDISTDDQYSYDDFGGGTVYDGAGTKLNLTPGTNVYFRKEADWSKKQTLTVPYRPGVPTFEIDYANERTSSVVSSEYEYSSNSDMSSATTGSGSYVSLTPGSSTYFRKLSTGSYFASVIQELFMSSVGNPDYSIDYSGEQTTEDISIDDQYSYDDFGGGTVYDGAGTKLNLTPGTNVYFRKEADWSKKQTLSVPYRPGAPSFGIDYANERTSSVVSSEYQYSSNSDMSSATTGSGSYVSLTPGSSTYFRKFSTGSAFASVIQELFMSSVDSPNYSIDYWGERTTEDVSTDDQYSYDNFAGGTVYDGAGTKLNLTPGTDVYFRKEADWSKKQTLTVPYRPGVPSFEVDYANERTSSVVSTQYQYSSNSDMSSATTGSESYVSLTPGSSTYIRKLATGVAFASVIQELVVPDRPVAPMVAINYIDESTESSISAELQYSASNGFETAESGTGVALSLVPGEDLYFRRSATSTNFSSEVFQLLVHERPVISSEESGSTALIPFTVDVTFFQEIASLENSSLTLVNAEMQDLKLKSSGTNETVFEGQVHATANDLITISVPANATQEGNFAANTFSISFTGKLPGVGIESAEFNSFMVYPNPGKGVFHIELEDFDALANYKVQCYSITGKVVHSETFFNSRDMSLDLSRLSEGIYLMRFYKDDQITGVSKLIIK